MPTEMEFDLGEDMRQPSRRQLIVTGFDLSSLRCFSQRFANDIGKDNCQALWGGQYFQLPEGAALQILSSPPSSSVSCSN